MSAIVGAGRTGGKSFLFAVEIYATVHHPGERITADVAVVSTAPCVMERLRYPRRAKAGSVGRHAHSWRGVAESAKLILFGEGSIRRALREFEVRYHRVLQPPGQGQSSVILMWGSADDEARANRFVTKRPRRSSQVLPPKAAEFFGYTGPRSTEAHTVRRMGCRLQARFAE